MSYHSATTRTHAPPVSPHIPPQQQPQQPKPLPHPPTHLHMHRSAAALQHSILTLPAHPIIAHHCPLPPACLPFADSRRTLTAQRSLAATACSSAWSGPASSRSRVSSTMQQWPDTTRSWMPWRPGACGPCWCSGTSCTQVGACALLQPGLGSLGSLVVHQLHAVQRCRLVLGCCC
jgi:hypothetical protein